MPPGRAKTSRASSHAPRTRSRRRIRCLPSGARVGVSFVTLEEIRAARERIRPIAKVTPLLDASGVAGRSLWLKCESLQPGGAFKIRGAYNMVAQLSDDERRRGVITYSSGNHGQAVAIAARALGAPAVVVMPTTAPRIKSDGPAGFRP